MKSMFKAIMNFVRGTDKPKSGFTSAPGECPECGYPILFKNDVAIWCGYRDCGYEVPVKKQEG